MMPPGQPQPPYSGRDDPKTDINKHIEDILVLLASRLTDIYADRSNIEYRYKDLKEALSGIYFFSMLIRERITNKDDAVELEKTLAMTSTLLGLDPVNNAQYIFCISKTSDLYAVYSKIMTRHIIKS